MVYFIIALLFILIQQGFFLYERREWKEERQKLLDRIQARDLPEYKVFEKPIEKKQEEIPKKEPEFL